MLVNYTTYAPGNRKIKEIFVHTPGENYEPHTLLRIDDGNYEC